MRILYWFFIDINECDRNIHDCHDNASCTNTIGDYNCTCHIGYTGDGFDCEGTGIVFLFYYTIYKAKLAELWNIEATAANVWLLFIFY